MIEEISTLLRELRETLEARNRAQVELATLRAENERLAKSLKEYKEAEESVSDAYLRIRALVKSYNTKPGGSDRFEVTEQAIKDLQNENERLKAKIGGPDYLLKLDTYEDTVRELMHELAVRDRQAAILDEEWDGRHTVESALAQARAEIAKEAEVKPEGKP
jgi:DNA repair exonuclease SbcCD ATPase subunit